MQIYSKISYFSPLNVFLFQLSSRAWSVRQAVLRSRIRDQVPFWSWTRNRNRFFFLFPDPGSWIQSPYFWELSDNFLCKKFYNSLKIGPNFFLQHFKNKKMFNYVKFVATIKVYDNKIFSPLSFAAIFGSGIRDGWKSRSGIYIPDPQHWRQVRESTDTDPAEVYNPHLIGSRLVLPPLAY